MVEQPADDFNAVNRGVYIADNLDFLRALNSATIDLVYIDPPFAKNETWEADKLRPPLTRSERAIERRLLRRWGIRSEARARDAGIEWPDESTRFSDIWTWEQSVHEEWLLSLEESHPAIKELCEAAEVTHSESMAAYLCYMAIRLIELQRVLKPTGSIYLHCDPTASHYLKGLMDAIFGGQSFRNEIVWGYRGMPSGGKKWQSKHDVLLFYSGGGDSTFHVLRGEFTEGTRRTYASAMRRGYNANHSRNMVTIFDEAKYRRAVADGKIPAGMRESFYSNEGPPLRDWWDDIRILGGPRNKERVGYPTQKPVSLLERIIRASSNEGDIVLDCFAGCATAALAAEKLNRRWVACDFNLRAWTVFKRQFSRPELTLRCNDETTGQQVLGTEPVVTIHGPGELPTRTSPETPAPRRLVMPERKFKVPASIIPAREMLEALLEMSDYQAWCCGFANRRPDGAIVRTTNNFHLDHIDPRSKEGSNQITNRAPLCPTHNVRKGARPIGLREYREEIAAAGELLVDSLDDLIPLPEAYQRALDYYSEARAAQAAQPSAD